MSASKQQLLQPVEHSTPLSGLHKTKSSLKKQLKMVAWLKSKPMDLGTTSANAKAETASDIVDQTQHRKHDFLNLTILRTSAQH